MEHKILLSADSTCDLSEAICQEYDIHIFPGHIIVDGKDHLDGVDLHPDDIYRIYEEKDILPKTAANSVGEYLDYFQKWVDEGYEIVHFTVGSALSAGYQNARTAAQQLSGVYVVDSRSLSTGIGLSVLQAARRIKAGMPAAQVAQEVQQATYRVEASFIVDTLEFLHKGGRCSSLAKLGANLLKLKPCIEVSAQDDGAMSVGKKYRGALELVLPQYVADKLANRDDVDCSTIFITHSGISEQRIELVKQAIEKYMDFEHCYVTRAGCVISSHCGPNTLGILFMRK